MSNPEDPKKAPDAPTESPTQNFKLKMGGWLDEIRQDFGISPPPSPEGLPTEEDKKPPAPPAPPAPPRRR